MTRREFLHLSASAVATRFIPLGMDRPSKEIRFAVITDLHHGLAPDAMVRLNAFAEAVRARKDLDLVLQLGDLCYFQPESKECLAVFDTLKPPKIHVLGNHDMDKCDKDTALRALKTKSRYGSQVHKGYRFITLDLNHFKKGGTLHSYVNGNYFTDNATHNWADPEQLAWLEHELLTSRQPVILLSHQPLGFAEPGQSIPPEQGEIMAIVDKCALKNPTGRVVISLFGHLHVDRLEWVSAIPYLCVNSASYFWYQGMRPYTKPLFAFMTIDRDGVLKVEGVAGDFVAKPPVASDGVVGRSGAIQDRDLDLHAYKASR